MKPSFGQKFIYTIPKNNDYYYIKLVIPIPDPGDRISIKWSNQIMGLMGLIGF